MTLIQRLFPPLPAWARADHPLLRHQLGAPARPARAVRLARAAGLLALAALLLIIGYVIATGGLRQAAGSYPVESVHNVVYYPLLAVQIVVSVLALLLTTGTVATAQRLQQWDNLRATPSGVDLLLRTRWAAVFYRLRGPLALILIARAVLLGLMLYDLTAFQGRYIDLLINGIQPETSVLVAVFMLALLMTAAVLLPITATGFDAAFGLLIATAVRQRTYSALVQILLILFRIVLVVLLVLGAQRFLLGQFPMSDPVAWLFMTLSAGVGDWGLGLLYLGRAGEIWATVPFGIFIGAALIGLCFLQALLADQMLAWAVRRAQRQE